MPIAKITTSQFASLIQTGMLSRDSSFDVSVGEIPDLTIVPQARVFERQHDDVRKVSLMLTLSAASEFEGPFEVDLEGIVFNEGLTRNAGAQATAVAVFTRSNPPATDIKVQRGYPIGTLPDEGTGTTITFVTTEERTMFVAQAASYYNFATQRYELSVPLVAVVEGIEGRVGAGRITRPLRPLVNFDSVTNPNAASGGRGRETNQELIDRYLIAIVGRGLATSTGIEKVAVDDFPDITDLLVVSGTNALLTRAADTAGAVDAYLIGSSLIEVTETPVFVSAGQLIPISTPPLVEVLSVQNLATGTAYTENTDYEVVYDETGLAKSPRAVEGIRFLATGSLPGAGVPIGLTYSYNNLVRRLQAAFDTDDKRVFGRDLLFKEAIEVPVTITARLLVLSGFDYTTVASAARTAILDLINNQRLLDDDIERFDVSGVVAQISGVDNLVYTRFSRSSVPSGVSDIIIDANEYASLATGDLFISPL